MNDRGRPPTGEDDGKLPLDLPLPIRRTCRTAGRIRGRDVAESNAAPAWIDGALNAIREMARTGRRFQAFDLVREFDLGEPDKPCRWGAVFALAHRQGVIVRVGAAPSHRRTVAKSLTSVWRGADAWIDPTPAATT